MDILPNGTRLLTLDGTKFGNAIVVSSEIVAGLAVMYTIETDFGNRLHADIQFIDDHWSYDLEGPVDLQRWYEERTALILREHGEIGSTQET